MRLGDEVVERAADEGVVALEEAAQQAAEIAALLRRGLELDLARHDLAGDLGQHDDVRVHDGGPETVRDRHVHDVELGVGTDEGDAAEEARADVVGMPGAIGRGFAGDDERQELTTRQRFTEETVDHEGAADRARGAGAEAAAEGHLLVDLHLDAEVALAEVTEQRVGGDAGGVLLGVEGQAAVVTGDLGDAEAGGGREAGHDLVAGGVDAEAKHVETAGHVGHGGRRKDTDFFERLSGHRTPFDRVGQTFRVASPSVNGEHDGYQSFDVQPHPPERFCDRGGRLAGPPSGGPCG